MEKQIITIFIFSVLLLVSSCAEKEEPAQITINENSIELFQDRIDISSEGGTKTIQFSTNKNWEISVSESGMGVDWCTVSPKSGAAGDITLTLTVPENTSNGERSVILILTAGDATKKFRVSQKQNDAILLSSTLYEVPMEGGNIELEVKSNVSYQVKIPEQYNDWIHKESTTRTLESKNLSFVIDGNVDYVKREGEIVITDGNITEVVKVYQAGGGILVLSKNEYNVPSDGATITVVLSSNFEYEFELPNVDWIKLNEESRGMSSHTLHFDILPNEEFDNRSTTIRFFDTTGSTSETITINQAKKDALFLYTPNNNALSYKEQTFEINLLTNVEFEISIDSEWIDYRSTRGLNESSILLLIKENNSPDNRSGQVVLRSDSFEQIINITQYGLPIDLSFQGTANSYIVPPKDAYFCLDASVAGNDKSYLLPKGTSASVICLSSNHYSQSNLVDNVEYESEKGRIIFRAKQSEGNALIALFDKDDKIIWSWHLWLTDYNPDEDFITFSNGSILMDRYLGASSEEGIGLYYQWGRKDPFDSGGCDYFIPSGAPITVEYCILHPNIFIRGDYGSTAWDWNTEHIARWSASKSVYDPCPPGWKVMDDSCIPSLSEDCFIDENSHCFIICEPNCTPQTKFRFTGLLHGYIQGTSEHISIWTNRGSYYNFYSALEKELSKSQNETNFRDEHVGRAYGHCIRCQRE